MGLGRALPAFAAVPAAVDAGPAPTRLGLRGILVDAARLPERLAYYRRLIDFCQQWNLNALLFRLTDDQGSALRWQSHPELVTHPNALTPEEMRELAAYGQRRGVMLIPEIESFGHTRYITSVPQHAALEDRDPRERQGFNGLSPLAPESLALIRDLYREAAAIFSAPYLHGGCDEVSWGGSERSQQALRVRSRAEIWAKYVNALDEICRQLGKELIVWGDIALRREPAILSALSRRVIVMDWQYHVTDPQPLAEMAQWAIDDGRRVIGAPAIISCSSGPRPGERQLRNIDAFADGYASVGDPRCLGVIVTNWVPSRYIQGSLWDSFAYAAVALERGSAMARQSGLRSFVERFYGTAWTPNWQTLFDTYYRIAPSWNSCEPVSPGPALDLPWASDADVRRALRAAALATSPYRELRATIKVAEPTVRQHADSFAALALSLEYLDHVLWREIVLKEVGPAPERVDAGRLIETIVTRDRSLVDSLDADWNLGRFSDAPAKRQPLPGLEPSDQLLFTMRRATQFSEQLAQDGTRFRQLLGL
jgi:Glycosyl hydrolase family 20, catalytic domain